MSLFTQEAMPAARLVMEADSVGGGGLRVGVPHWATRIDVYDGQLVPIASTDPVTQGGRTPRRFETDVDLEGGIYVVEASLAGRVERLEVPVSPGTRTTIEPSHWTSLSLQSAAPLAGTETANASQAAAAEEWSRKPTWPEARGDSRLVLFVRNASGERHPTFWRGLKLLDPAGREIVDLSAVCKHDARQGWAVFNAALPAGGYIIRRGGNNISLRYQPIWLLPGWTTQVFAEAERYPRLHSMAMNLVVDGHGFQADDGSFEAAEVIRQDLKQPEVSRLATHSRVRDLLEQASPSPWLGIVAATALLMPRTVPGGEPETLEPDALPDYLAAAVRLVAEHPDARALALPSNRDASAPFWFPPLLRASVRRVLHHWDSHPGTILEGSLTDLVPDTAITNSPWTAWRTLDQLPAPAPTPLARRGQGRSLFLTTGVTQVTRAIAALSAELARLSSPAAPAYYLARQPHVSDVRVVSLLLDLVRKAARSNADKNDPVVQIGCEIMRPGGARTVPLSVTVTRDDGDPLNDVSVDDIIAASGMSQSRVERVLQRWREIAPAERTANDGGLHLGTRSDIPVLQAVLRYTSNRDAGASSEPLPRRARDSIEEAIVQLRFAARLVSGVAGKPRQEIDSADAKKAGALAQRLNGVADTLLASAGFSVVTDVDGRIVVGNGAFRDLLLPGLGDDAKPGKDRRSRRDSIGRQEAWERALAKTKPRQSELRSPVSSSLSETWNLQRTAVSEAGGESFVLYVLRVPGMDALDGETLKACSPLLRCLSLAAPLFAYGLSVDGRHVNLQQIEKLATQFEGLVGVPGRA